MRKECRDNFAALREKGENVCAECGCVLDETTAVIEHIIPVRYGGSNRLENLYLLCGRCNRRRAGRSFSEHRFERYIESLLCCSAVYSNVQREFPLHLPENRKAMVDLKFQREGRRGSETVLAEVVSSMGLTHDRVYSLIERFRHYRAAMPDAALAFVFPGSISDRYRELLRENSIEIWDLEYIQSAFRREIEQLAKESDLRDAPVQAPGRCNRVVAEELDEYEKAVQDLKRCLPGASEWGKYQKLIGRVLELLFCPPLGRPLVQNSDAAAANRRDYIMENTTYLSNWRYLRERYFADYIVMDAKNSAKCITKEDVLQMAHYLKKMGTGLFGIICARKGTGKAAKDSLRDAWIHEGKMIVVLDDNDIEQMLLDKRTGEDPTRILMQKIVDFRLSI